MPAAGRHPREPGNNEVAGQRPALPTLPGSGSCQPWLALPASGRHSRSHAGQRPAWPMRSAGGRHGGHRRQQFAVHLLVPRLPHR
ncbi:hypothetical protein FEO89_06625 [Stenotrophomonas maltophilia]|nr:hypothetical protein FEO89_06625 [Stenotrophomonas maltophilia]